MRDQRFIEGIVANIPLFRGAAPTVVAGVARQCSSVSALRGALVVPCGAHLPGIFALAQGTVKLALRNGQHEERVLCLVQPGQTFGEATALTGRAAPYEARALAECKLVVIPAAAVYAALESDARTARQVVHAIAERYFDLLAELQSASMRRGSQRLASYLQSLAGPSAPDGACTVKLPATKTVIASRLDMKKETLSRLLRSLAERGLIAVTQREIRILDREALGHLTGI